MRSAERFDRERKRIDLIARLRDHSPLASSKRVLLREAESLLFSYHVEEIRYFMRAGVFGKPLRAAVKDYLFKRITNGDLDAQTPRSDSHRG